jgi:hypothetical protein
MLRSAVELSHKTIKAERESRECQLGGVFRCSDVTLNGFTSNDANVLAVSEKFPVDPPNAVTNTWD